MNTAPLIRLDLTLDDPVANVCFDEALLEHAETLDNHPEVLRLWESPRPMVVLGRSSPWKTEANVPYCQQHQIPMVRRCSGGQAIVAGPGCLMYALLLDYRKRPELRLLDQAHQFVMGQMRTALESVGVDCQIQGTSDLTWQGQKFSGNSLRCKKDWMLYHGTMLLGLPVELIANCLGTPIRQPDYRDRRSHQAFLTQLNVAGTKVADAIATTWNAHPVPLELPIDVHNQLMKNKYSTPAWNQKV